MLTKRFVVITNIPSPYRIHEFSILNTELAKHQIEFEAVFLTNTERGRHWQFDATKCSFPYKMAAGWQFYIGGKPFILNPQVLWSQFLVPPTWLLLGGSWYLPTNILLSFAKRLLSQTWLLGWNESTPFDNHTLKGSLSVEIRKLLLSPYHGWVVPGSRAAEYAQQELTHTRKPTLYFKNTVDELIYRDKVALLRLQRPELRVKYDLRENEMVLLWVARLSPEKAILPMLESIKTVKGHYSILIAGEGPQRAEIEAWLQTHPSAPVKLLGHQDNVRLAELYAVADVLMLPSLSEPYGFAAVEALWANLPLLLSNRVGAMPEVLELEVNGWVVDPTDERDMRETFQHFLSMDCAQLHLMGQSSGRIAEQQFSSARAAASFVDQLLTTFPPSNTYD